MSYMSNNTFFLILCFQFAVAFQSTDTADIIAYKLLHSVSNITPKRFEFALLYNYINCIDRKLNI